MKLQLAAAILLWALPAPAQWFDFQHKGVPRNEDGTVNMTAPAPKLPNGKPDVSGLWQGDNWGPRGARPNPPPRGVRPSKMLPWAEAEFARRTETNMKDDPKVQCLPNGVPHANLEPYPFEIIYTPEKTLMLYEMYSLRREVFTDGRTLPEDREEFTPTWMGYSVGHWEDDTFVVETQGFNKKVWPIDMFAHPSSTKLKVTERFKRVDFGHMDLEITVDDPETYEEPWTHRVNYTLIPDADLLEFECEVNTSASHLIGGDSADQQ